VTPDQRAIAYDRKFVEKYGLLGFGWLAWPLIEPSVPFVYSRVLEELVKHIEACYRGQLKKTLIAVPPGTGKSIWASVLADAHVWTYDPGFMSGSWSFADMNVRRDATKFLQIVQSKWYRERWPGVVLRRTAPAAAEIWNTAGGLRFSSTVHGQGTGWHLHLRKFDDPIKPADTMGSAAATQLELDFVNRVWWDGTIATRIGADPKNARYMGIMQRLHENDLVGYIQRTDPEVVTLALPMRFEGASRCVTPIGGDWRTEEGALLMPERYPEEVVAKLERSLGVYARAQLQQDPVNPEGTVFKKASFRRWTELPRLACKILTVDATFKGNAGCDRVSLQVWGSDGKSGFYLIDNYTKVMGFFDTVAAIKMMLAKHPTIGAKLIEDKANGSAIIEALRRAGIMGVIPVEPEGGKEARANAVSYLFEAGNVWLPEDSFAPWVSGYVAELLAFPRGRHDDQVDSTTQALAYLSKNSGTVWAWVDEVVDKERQLLASLGLEGPH